LISTLHWSAREAAVGPRYFGSAGHGQSLAAGSTYTASATAAVLAMLAPGTYYLLVFADSGTARSEWNAPRTSADNRREYDFSCD
jgi:hypothetical protein